MPDPETAGRRAPVADRGRHLATFVHHVALAGQLRLMRPPGARPARTDPALRAVVLSAHPPAHIGTVSRFSRWLPYLEQLGCRLEILTPCSDAEWAAYGHGDGRADQRYYSACIRNCRSNLRRAATADVVVLHRGLLPFSPWQRPTFEEQLARLNPRIVYDFYDALWVQRQDAGRQSSPIRRWLSPPDKIEALIALARVVTVSNERLAKFARAHHPDVRVIPMLIDTQAYQPARARTGGPVVLGWLGNHHQIPRLLSLAPVLRRLASSREIVLRVVTSEPVEISGVPVESRTHPWSAATERDDLAGLDIGLLPLEEESAHDQGKSPFKLLQYAAAGVATVATPVAIDESVLRPGECFLPARDEREWTNQLMALIDDAALRTRVGAAGRAAVRKHYSFESYAPKFLDALRVAAGWS